MTSVEKRVEQESKLSKSPVCVLNKELKVSVMLVHLVFPFTNENETSTKLVLLLQAGILIKRPSVFSQRCKIFRRRREPVSEYKSSIR